LYRLFAHGYFAPPNGPSSFLQSIATDCDSETTLAVIDFHQSNAILSQLVE